LYRNIVEAEKEARFESKEDAEGLSYALEYWATSIFPILENSGAIVRALALCG
jgi:hypothetical protein